MLPPAPQPLVVAHRGVHGPGVPENTIAAFEAATAAGAEMVELDVRRAADGELKEDGYVEEVAALLLDFQRHDGRLLVSSFLERVLAQLGAGLRKGVLLSITARAAGARSQRCGAHALIVDLGLLDDAVLRDAATHGLDLYVWDYLAGRDGPGPARDPRIAGVITDDVPSALIARAAASISR
jgi:hypothetical protein